MSNDILIDEIDHQTLREKRPTFPRDPRVGLLWQTDNLQDLEFAYQAFIRRFGRSPDEMFLNPEFARKVAEWMIDWNGIEIKVKVFSFVPKNCVWLPLHT